MEVIKKGYQQSISFRNIKSNYILKQIFKNLREIKHLNIIRYNKVIQNRLNKSINDYKELSKIEIDITPIKVVKEGIFINISNNESYFHIYLNDDKEETKTTFCNYICDKRGIRKLKVIIDYEIKSFKGLFENCEKIQKINFIKFNRNNIYDMSNLFCGCESLTELTISNINTGQVINMSNMFSKCRSLKKIDLSNFDTNNVIDMSFMFHECCLLTELNLSNFNTKNLKNMSHMFDECNSL